MSVGISLDSIAITIYGNTLSAGGVLPPPVTALNWEDITDNWEDIADNWEG